MKYIVLYATTTIDLEDKINAISDTHKPSGSITVDRVGNFILIMEEK